MIIRSEDAEREAVLCVARLMVTAARTAPKAGGRDNIKTLILVGEEKDRLADETQNMGGIIIKPEECEGCRCCRFDWS